MKKAVCHYSFHRTVAAEKWTAADFVEECAGLGVEGVDFHQRFLPSPDEAPDLIREALEGSGLELSGLSLSTNFVRDADEFAAEIDTAVKWIEAAAAAGASVSRVFGGYIPDRSNDGELRRALDKVTAAMKELAVVAKEKGVVLALENHGGVPGTGEEQVEVIERVASPFLRATVDVGNYLSCGQDPVEGASRAASYCAYVHFKDMKRTPAGLVSTVVGEGDVDHRACLRVLHEAGYDGYVALEFEAEGDEREGVRRSLSHMEEVMKNYA